MKYIKIALVFLLGIIFGLFIQVYYPIFIPFCDMEQGERMLKNGTMFYTYCYSPSSVYSNQLEPKQ